MPNKPKKYESVEDMLIDAGDTDSAIAVLKHSQEEPTTEVAKLREENRELRDMLKRVAEHGCLKRPPPCNSSKLRQHDMKCTVCRDLAALIKALEGD